MHITGTWNNRQVFIDGHRLLPDDSQKVWNHSPDGFNWGYEGSGPAQLALAILLHAAGGDKSGIGNYQEFKHRVIANLPSDDFDIDVDISSYLIPIK